jgi:hypothetical protein
MRRVLLPVPITSDAIAAMRQSDPKMSYVAA